MLLAKKFFIHKKEPSFVEFLVKKTLTKYVYTKLLIYKTVTFSKKKIFLVDNFLNEFNIKIKKNFRRLNFLTKLKSGDFFKGNLFIYKHSKLSFYYFISLGFKTYIKKNIYLNLNSLKCLLKKSNFIFIFKSIRGGFLGFSNKICGYISKNILIKSKEKLLKYKKYCLLGNSTCLPFISTNAKSFFFFNTGFIKNFRKSKNSFRTLIFKRFKFFFNFNRPYYKRFLFYIISMFHRFFNKNLNNYFYNIFLKLYKFLLF
jgi:hypothetical protein